MISKLFVLTTDTLDPYLNLAREKYLLDHLVKDSCTLYLWRNQKTVVIGRNQLAVNQCNIERLKEDGGHLARRLSGGGAVYHDLGNLNFTFLMNREDFDEHKQTEVIRGALKMAGIDCQKSGRNDLLVNGRKFSGHAYYHHNGHSFHHGTLMIDVDFDDLNRYLNVPVIKLQDKHVDSVRSRVINLSEVNGNVSVDLLKEKLVESFQKEYGLKADIIDEESLDLKEITESRRTLADEKWIMGETGKYAHSCQKKSDWGIIRIDYDLSGDIITDCAVYSDGLNADFLTLLPELIKGRNIRKLNDMTVRKENEKMMQDIVSLLQGENI